MTARWMGRGRWALLALLLVAVQACAAAAIGAAGAAAGIYLTDQGAEGMVQGSLAEVDARTQAVLAEMGITVQHREAEEDEIEYHGERGDLDINVELKPAGANTTKVTVSARENAVEWDKEYARDVVRRIVQRG